MGTDDITRVAPSEPFEQQLRAGEHSLATMRHALRDWLEPTVDSTERRLDIVLAASELGSAALRTLWSRDTTVTLRAEIDGADILLECRAERAVPGAEGSFPTAWLTGDEGERAFSIIAALADVFAVKTAPERVVGRARMHRKSLHAASR
jgi:hypothetical protein